MPRASYIAITAPAPERLAEIGWTSGVSLYDYRSALRYFRTTPDGRIAMGVGGERGTWSGKVDERFDFDERGTQHAVDAIHRLFPSFRDVPIEARWGGPIDVTSSHQPFAGSFANDRIHYALGYTGNGVGPSHLMGKILANRILDRETEDTRLPLVDYEPRRFPPQPFRSLGAAVVNAATVRRDDALDGRARSTRSPTSSPGCRAAWGTTSARRPRRTRSWTTGRGQLQAPWTTSWRTCASRPWASRWTRTRGLAVRRRSTRQNHSGRGRGTWRAPSAATGHNTRGRRPDLRFAARDRRRAAIERRPEPREPAPRPRLDRPQRPAEPVRDLGLRQPLAVGEHQYLPLGFGQIVDEARELRGGLDVHGRRLRQRLRGRPTATGPASASSQSSMAPASGPSPVTADSGSAATRRIRQRTRLSARFRATTASQLRSSPSAGS